MQSTCSSTNFRCYRTGEFIVSLGFAHDAVFPAIKRKKKKRKRKRKKIERKEERKIAENRKEFNRFNVILQIPLAVPQLLNYCPVHFPREGELKFSVVFEYGGTVAWSNKKTN